MPTYRFYPKLELHPSHFLTVKAPSWYLARDRARTFFDSDALGWVETKAKADVTIEYVGSAASNPSTLRIVERGRKR